MSTFEAYLSKPELRSRYEKIRPFFHLRESAYDISSICQLRCDGCYYFQGEKYKVKPVRDPAVWDEFFEREKDRGINFANLAGAEPALVPELLRICSKHIPTGTVFTNGLKPIDSTLRYRVHISIWGGPTGDPIYRKRVNGSSGEYCLPTQLRNYHNDNRAVFVYTFNSKNVDQLDGVLDAVSAEGHQLTFNVFSPPDGAAEYLTDADLDRIRAKMIQALQRHPATVLYSYYNARVHTSQEGLYNAWGCPYPRSQSTQSLNFGLRQTFRSYRVDLTHRTKDDCCVPDTDCNRCRHYAAGSAIITSRLKQHCETEELFRQWLDYVDTYLAVFVLGYKRDSHLFLPSACSLKEEKDDSRLPSECLTI